MNRFARKQTGVLWTSKSARASDATCTLNHNSYRLQLTNAIFGFGETKCFVTRERIRCINVPQICSVLERIFGVSIGVPALCASLSNPALDASSRDDTFS